jgi:diaminopimelate epimerase
MKFYKYHGTGNDFIMIDGYHEMVNISIEDVQRLCHRRFGIGADGLIVLRKHKSLDFEMDYYNPDGSKSFCGNGSRCAQAFAKDLDIIKDKSSFLAIDGIHSGKSIDSNFATLMGDVSEINKIDSDYFIYTGSPHYIRYVENVDTINVQQEGSIIRYSEEYNEVGTNVNFVNIKDNYLKVRTYERGVEAETLSCGTGVTAVAISYLLKVNSFQNSVSIKTLGGDIQIKLDRSPENEFTNVWLIGPAIRVFEGEF